MSTYNFFTMLYVSLDQQTQFVSLKYFQCDQIQKSDTSKEVEVMMSSHIETDDKDSRNCKIGP